MTIVPVIMAGGRGERFWPKSRAKLPKQFLNLLGKQSMLQLTVQRLTELVSLENIHIVTGQEYRSLVSSQIPDLPSDNLIIEPVGRNTAPCIGLAATVIKRKYGQDAIMIVVPSDHLIEDSIGYLDTLQTACEAAHDYDNTLVTIGIAPTEPATGYGYIQIDKVFTQMKKHSIYQVKRFVEKPDYETATAYLSEGGYYWNSGMFIFTVDSMLRNIQTHMPDLYRNLQDICLAQNSQSYERVLNNIYPQMPSISIDYGVMEKADQVMVIPADFGWDDIGSWTSLERIRTKNDGTNVIRGNVVSLDSKRCIVEADCQEKLIVLLGADDLIVVDTDDATLICSKDRAQDIKTVIDNLKKNQQEKYL